MTLNFEDLAHSLTATTSSAFSRPRLAPRSSGVRSKKVLPFPLPDPWATNDVHHDPHGLFTSRSRSESVTSSGAASTSGSAGGGGGLHSRESTAASSEPATASPKHVSRGERVENGQLYDNGGTRKGKEKDAEPYSGSQYAESEVLQPAAPINIEASPSSRRFSSTSSSSPRSGGDRGRTAFHRFRIGSAGSATMEPFLEDTPSAMRVDSPDVFGNGSSEGEPSESAFSPAASFLSSFTPGDSWGRNNGFGSFVAPSGDEEGFITFGYRLGRELGVGGFGIVREAVRIADGEIAAVKIVRREAEAESSFSAAVADGLRRSTSGVNRGGKGASGLRRTFLPQERNRSASSPNPLNQNGSYFPPSLPPSPGSFNLRNLSSSISSLPPTEEALEEPTLRQSLLDREISLWKQLAPHPHIMPLLAVHHTHDFSYIFMPLCSGGNLFTLLANLDRPSSSPSRNRRKTSMPIAPLSPSVGNGSPVAVRERKGLKLSACLPIFAQIVSGLHYLHSEAGVTHKDIKLENILCDEPNGTWIITDFGLTESATASAQKGRGNAHDAMNQDAGTSFRSHFHSASTPVGTIDAGTPLSSLSRAGSLSRPNHDKVVDEHLYPAGSLPYSPPEQMKSPIPILDRSVDIWALGCVLYALISGSLPFSDEFEPRLRMKIMKGEWTVPAVLEISYRGDARDTAERVMVLEVLRGCLDPDPCRRWTIEQIKASEWLSGDRARGRSRARPPVTGRTASSSHSQRSRASSESATRRKERSTSRGPGSHYVDSRTKDMELQESEREQRKMRWDRERERKGSRSRSERRAVLVEERLGEVEERLSMVAEPY